MTCGKIPHRCIKAVRQNGAESAPEKRGGKSATAKPMESYSGRRCFLFEFELLARGARDFFGAGLCRWRREL
jgi:hypothetical protein